MFKYTEEQEKFLETVEKAMEQNFNIICPSTAGSGKTFALKEAAKLINDKFNLPVLYIVYGKANQQEALPKFKAINPDNEVVTSHVCGNNIRRSNGQRFKPSDGDLYFKACKLMDIIDLRKNRGLSKADKDFNNLKKTAFFSGIKPLIEMAMNLGIMPDKILENIPFLMDEFEIILGGGRENIGLVQNLVMENIESIYESYLQDHFFVDFNKMLMSPIIQNLTLKDNVGFGAVLIDECQDFNWMQIEMIKRCIQPLNIPLIFVGDDEQSIYSWRGALPDALGIIKKEFECVECQFTQTFRCSKKIVDYARKFSNRIISMHDAVDGEIGGLNKADFMQQVEYLDKDDLILCRNNAPLFQVVYSLFKKGIPAKIIGREIGKELGNFCLNQIAYKNQGMLIDEFLGKLNEWVRVQKENYMANGKDDFTAIDDKADCIVTIAEGCSTVQDLLDRLDNIFAEPDKAANCVRFSTIHRAKGLEAERVYWLQVKEWRRNKPWQINEERCCKFVAATRAKKTLVVVQFEEV